jgi:hypothetical protein
MPLTTPISGKLGKIEYGATPKILGITDWTYKPMGNPLDVSNTSDGRRRINGLSDAEGDFNLHVDTAATMEADLAPGTIITISMFTDGTKKYLIPTAVIDTITYKNAIEGTYDAAVSWKLASGTAPAAPV